MARRDVALAENSKAALNDFLIDLHDIWYVWYEKSVTRHYWLWLPITVFALLSGFATSIIAALATEESLKGFAFVRILLVVLPALGAALSTVAVQSRLHDRYNLREDGRRAVQALWNEGRRRFAAATTAQEYTTIHADLEARLDRIEKDQAIGFFSLAAPPSQKPQATGTDMTAAKS